MRTSLINVDLLFASTCHSVFSSHVALCLFYTTQKPHVLASYLVVACCYVFLKRETDEENGQRKLENETEKRTIVVNVEC